MSCNSWLFWTPLPRYRIGRTSVRLLRRFAQGIYRHRLFSPCQCCCRRNTLLWGPEYKSIYFSARLFEKEEEVLVCRILYDTLVLLSLLSVYLAWETAVFECVDNQLFVWLFRNLRSNLPLWGQKVIYTCVLRLQLAIVEPAFVYRSEGAAGDWPLCVRLGRQSFVCFLNW